MEEIDFVLKFLISRKTILTLSQVDSQPSWAQCATVAGLDKERQFH